MINGKWKVVVPTQTPNYILNPSAESSTNYSALGGASVGPETTYQIYGASSYRILTFNHSDGISLTTDSLIISPYTVTFRVRGKLPTNLRVILGNEIKPPLFIEHIRPYWDLYAAYFNVVIPGTELRIIQQGPGRGDFYLDGIQAEPLPYWTTYCDGDQEGCTWNGTKHASTSTRSAKSSDGGQVVDLYDNYGFLVTQHLGVGAISRDNNIDEFSNLPGGELNEIKIEPRDFSLVGKFVAKSEKEIRDNRNALFLLLNSYQSLKWLFYKPNEIREIKAIYNGGLEGESPVYYDSKWVLEGDDKWTEIVSFVEPSSIQLKANDPYFYRIGENSNLLDVSDGGTFRLIAGRLKSIGQWDDLGSPNVTGAIYALAEDSNYIYIGGDFTNFDNIAAADYIVRYNKQTGLYSALDVGLNGIVYSLAFASDDNLYIGGAFTNAGGIANADYLCSWDGTNFNAVGVPLTGAASIVSVRTLCFDLSGNLYIGGDFTNWNNISNADYIVMWNGIAYSALSTTTNGIVYSIAVNPISGNIAIGGAFTTIAGVAANYIGLWDGATLTPILTGMNASVRAVAFDRTGVLYIGGTFTTSGGETTNRITAWDGSRFLVMGGGASDVVYSLSVGPDNTLYIGGDFASIGGLTLTDKIAKWNGYAFGHLDINLPGVASIYSILTSKYADAVIPQKYDIYLGFNTTGNGNFGGDIIVTNEGNIDSYPKIIVRGGVGVVSIVTFKTFRNETTNKELLFNYIFQGQETLVIDLSKKSILSSYYGSRLDAVLANSNFGDWSLEPGTNKITCFSTFTGFPSFSAYIMWRTVFESLD